MVRKKAAVCGEERCVTSLKTAAKETILALAPHKNVGHKSNFAGRVEKDSTEHLHKVVQRASEMREKVHL